MKPVFILFTSLTLLHFIHTSFEHNKDIIGLKKSLIIYADGVSKELLNAKMPVIDSWRLQFMEIRNLCKIVDCNYAYPSETNFPNRFVSNKCFIESDEPCKTQTERNAIYKLEEIFHESDFSTYIVLDGETFGIVANSKTEDAIIFEVGDDNVPVEEHGESHQESHQDSHQEE